MEINIVSNMENKLFERHEISFRILGEEKTPPASEVRKELCKKLNLSPDATLVRSIRQEFGTKVCTGEAVSYQKPELMQKYEKKYKIARRDKAENKGAVEKKAEA